MPVNIIGLNKLVSDLINTGPQGLRMADAVIAANVDQMVVRAKQLAPADLGTIRQNIGKQKINNGGSSIVGYSFFSNAPESGFQEFGTGGKVSVPTELADVAAEFQGQKGGNMAAFIQALTGWVKRKGINPIGSYQVSTRSRISKGNKTDLDEQTAWAIARSILINGLPPQPFFYPAYVEFKDNIIPMLQKAFDELSKTV